ncbi:MAG: cysteine desulfurase family protein [Gammaproteobacteria bacterium]|nr:cysteine desulfurase family protein [Gammaproteobacteria bacterium]
MSVYLDHNASSPLHPDVLEEMLPFLSGAGGNPSSLHQSGRFLRSALETARQRVAALINADPAQVIFTSGGTEANNLALKGMLPLGPQTCIVSSQVEHASVLQPLIQAAAAGCRTELLAVTEQGVIDIASASRVIDELQPDMLSVQMANNETGVIQPLAELAALAHRQVSTLVHSDATQAAGKVEVDMQQLGVDLLTLSAHKFNGPQGCGALVVKNQRIQNPLLSGGPQESNRRAGTENVALLVGMGKAAEIARIKLQEKQAYLLELRRFFEQRLDGIPGVHIFSSEVERLPNTSFFAIPYYHGETLLMQLDQAGFELASGSACHSEVTRPSHVLSAMAVPEELALNAVRVSFGMENTRQQIEQFVETLNGLINQLPAAMRQVIG